MKILTKLFLINIILLPLIFSCNNKEKYSAPVFKEAGTVSGETIIHDVMCTKIIKMNVIDSLLILHCYNTLDKKQLYIYNKYSGKLLKTYGHVGNGPGELPDITNISLDKQNRTIYALGQYKSILYNIDSILNGKQYKYDREFACNLGSISSYGFMKDSLLWGLMGGGSMNRAFRVAVTDLRGDIIAKNMDLPPICETDIDDTLFRYVFYAKYSLGVLKPDASKFAVATTCGLHLELFTISEKGVLPESFHRYIKPEYTVRGQGPDIKYESMEGIVQYLCATDKYIYAPWSKDNMKVYPKEVVTFDWNGNAVSRFRFDSELQPEICVENNDAILYGVVKDDEGKLNIVKYNLPITL